MIRIPWLWAGLTRPVRRRSAAQIRRGIPIPRRAPALERILFPHDVEKVIFQLAAAQVESAQRPTVLGQALADGLAQVLVPPAKDLEAGLPPA
jgi:hypothetical protein